MQQAKTIMLGILAALFALSAVPVQAGSGEDDVQAVMDALQRDWNAGDMAGYLSAYVKNADLRLLSGIGILKGWDTVDTLFREQFPDEPRMGDFTMDAVEVRLLSDDVALASGKFEHVFAEQTIRGLFSHVLRRQPDGRWRIELEHVSRTEAGE